jgi:hypothetical protein
MAVMRHMGFESRWINLIMMCVTLVQYAVAVNGKPCRKIKPQRGLRQGVTPPKLVSAIPVESLAIYPFKPTCDQKRNNPYKTIEVNAR